MLAETGIAIPDRAQAALSAAAALHSLKKTLGAL
jgi:hypothetical protein